MIQKHQRIVRSLCLSAAIAAVYAVLTLSLPVLSYGPVQLRLAEALTVLAWFCPEAIPGLTLGCFLSNLLGSPYVLDWVFGTLATLLAALWTSRMPKRWMAPIPPVVCNMVIVGAEIAWFETGFGPGFAARLALERCDRWHGRGLGLLCFGDPAAAGAAQNPAAAKAAHLTPYNLWDGRRPGGPVRRCGLPGNHRESFLTLEKKLV